VYILMWVGSLQGEDAQVGRVSLVRRPPERLGAASQLYPCLPCSLAMRTLHICAPWHLAGRAMELQCPRQMSTGQALK